MLTKRPLRLAAGLAFTLTIGAGRLLGAAPSWTSAAPDGGTATALAVGPGRTLLAATASAGVFGSRDGGATWRAARAGLPLDGPIWFLTGAGAKRVAYAASGSAVFRSADAGRTWKACGALGLTPGDGSQIAALAASPSDGNLLFVLTSGRPGLLASADGCATWQRRGADQLRGVLSDHAMVVAGTNPQRLYLLIHADGTSGLRLARSVDRGLHWTTGDELPLGEASALAVDPRDPQRLFVTDGRGVARSDDGGGTWLAPVEMPGRSEDFYDSSGVAIDDAAPANMVLWRNYWVSGQGTWYGGGLARYAGELLRSSDAGQSWTRVGATDTVADVAFSSGVGVAAVGRVGLLRSVDGGASWADSNRGLAAVSACGLAFDPFTAGQLYVGASPWCTDASKLVSANSDPGILRGRSAPPADATLPEPWSKANRGVRAADWVLQPWQVVPDLGAQGRLYAATAQGLFTTENGGDRWRRLPTGLDGVVSVAIDPADSNRLYALGFTFGYPICGGFCPLALEFGGARSLDRGRSWQPLHTATDLGWDIYGGFDPATFGLTIDPRDGRIYLYTHAGLDVSADRGASWSALPTGADTARRLTRVFVDGTTPGALHGVESFLGTGRTRPVHSSDRGVSWTLADAGLPVAAHARTLAIDPAHPTTVYAATDRGVYVSRDHSAWMPLSQGLTSRDVRDLRVDPFQPGRLIAATAGGGGIFVLDDDAER